MTILAAPRVAFWNSAGRAREAARPVAQTFRACEQIACQFPNTQFPTPKGYI
jgi:hypothetical protein